MKRFVFIKIAQAIGVLALAFVILRITAPWLVNLHDTLALILAVVLIIGLVFITAWFAWDLVGSILKRRGDDA